MKLAHLQDLNKQRTYYCAFSRGGLPCSGWCLKACFALFYFISFRGLVVPSLVLVVKE